MLTASGIQTILQSIPEESKPSLVSFCEWRSRREWSCWLSWRGEISIKRRQINELQASENTNPVSEQPHHEIKEPPVFAESFKCPNTSFEETLLTKAILSLLNLVTILHVHAHCPTHLCINLCINLDRIYHMITRYLLMIISEANKLCHVPLMNLLMNMSSTAMLHLSMGLSWT